MLAPDLEWYISAIMLKRLAILAVFCPLATVGILCAQGTPKQGVTKGSLGLDGKKETASQNKDQDTQKPPSVVVQVETPVSDAESAAHADDRQIQGKLALYTEMLVAVGFLQFVALAGTLWIVRRQVEIMDKQTEIMNTHAGHLENLAIAADASSKATTEIQTAIQKQAELMGKTLVLQFRPKVIIRFAGASEFNLADLGKPATAKVRLNIVNSGGSPAHISVGKVALWWTEMSRSHSRRIEIHEGTERELGEFTLQPGKQCRWEETLDMNAINDLQWVNYHEGLATEDNRTLILVGGLYYTDDLSIPRSTGIHRNYDPKMMNFRAADDEGEYAD